MRVKIDFVRDYAEVLRQRLTAAGYAAVAGEKNEDTIMRYLNVLNRRIEPRRRQTKKASTFICPANLQAGLQLLIDLSEKGDSLRPHQSKQIGKAEYDDAMLNDWGIHHFHLGTVPDAQNPNFISRTGPVLYAAVAPDTLCCLAVLNHGEWSNRQLLEAMHANFPELTAPFTIKNVVRLSVDYTDAQIKKLRAVGANVIIQLSDGTVIAGPGGGMTAGPHGGGRSLKVRRAADEIIEMLQTWQEVVEQQLPNLSLPSDLSDLQVKLSEENGALVVSDTTGGLAGVVSLDPVRRI